MRLRYLHLWGTPPLQELITTFNQEQILGRKCAIRFVVGVNGTGKTQLLQTLTEIFLSLERKRLPPFRVTFAYDLEKIGEEERPATIYLRYPQDTPSSTAILAVFEPRLEDQDWEALEKIPIENFETEVSGISFLIRGDQLGSNIRPYLPKVLLAYTSGATETWATLFANQQTERENLPDAVFEEITLEEERPPNWDLGQEKLYRGQEGLEALLEPELTCDEAQTSSIGYYVFPQALKLVFFAVALHQARKDFQEMATEQGEQAYRDRIEQAIQNHEPMTGLRGLFNKIDWLWLISVNFQILFQPTHFSQQSRPLARLYPIATAVIREPVPSDCRKLVFDLRRSLPNQTDIDTSTCAALIRAICDKLDTAIDEITPFDIFKQLLSWQEQGWLQDLTMTFCKRNVEDVLLYNWLSDGERVFLGRMALFQLLRGENDALMILDEPETHFNDVWKREIVDIIDTSLRDNNSEVIISTHSSISLTDVFDTEITLLYKNEIDGAIAIIEPRITTFGASPNEIMIDIFDAPESVGKRATEFLDLVLMLAAHPDHVQTVWAVIDSERTTILQLREFQQLREFVQELPHQYDGNDSEQLNDQILRVLKSIRKYTQRKRDKEDVSVTETLEVLKEKIGPGYYEFEFRRRLRALRERESSVS
ncbi:AAA family ATPase [Nostoc sp. CCY 9925]|uniref:AAA family ATPase n=1 Tax=Nostoc sp. CCY 9925 TaxID=3103865 RepID=UPI0039C64434